MSPLQVRLAAVKAAAERDWREVKRQLDRARSVDPSKGELESAFVALAIDHAYQAFEQLLLSFERALRLPERTGEHWHRALLADAVAPLPSVRPALVSADAEEDWQHVLGFRHFLRRAYAVDLDPARLALNVDRLTRAVRATDPVLRAVITAITDEGSN